jgi:nicotinate-nucleotide pyrophosphorylase (carboxylating)
MTICRSKPFIVQEDYRDFIRMALQEDIGEGDFTSLACVSKNAKSKAFLLVKESGVLAGVSLAEQVFQVVDADLRFEMICKDGTLVEKGDIAFEVHGSSQSLLKSERLVLNLMQHLSGIATQTRQVVDKLQGTKTQVLDSRKTTPLLRSLEKYAVKVGGGHNHRFGLYDMILIKDNHITNAGSVTNALTQTKSYLSDNHLHLQIEIEVRNLQELAEVLACGGVDRIMLDNFSIADTQAALEKVAGRFPVESSGGITLDNVRAYADLGVDYVSMGCLTHSVRALDLSLKQKI